MYGYLAAWLLVIGGITTAPLSQEPADGRTHAVPDRALDHGMLRSVYFDVLGRPPYLIEQERWLGKGLRELLDELIGSEEHWSAWTGEQLFHFLLIDNFAPKSERVRNLPEAMKEGRLDPREAIHRICLSSSFELRNPGADTFVTVILEQLVGIEVQKQVSELEIGKKLYDGSEGLFLGKLGDSQSDVVKIAIESKRFSQEFLKREYARIVRTDPPRKSLAKWVRGFHKNPDAYQEQLKEWMLSGDYRARLESRADIPNRLFVRTLYVDLMDRLPSAEEEEPLREALDGLSDSGPLRSIVARMLLDSDLVELPKRENIEDRGQWIEDLFLRLLGRSPSPEERTTFTEAFADPSCHTETVVYALISHRDYQSY